MRQKRCIPGLRSNSIKYKINKIRFRHTPIMRFDLNALVWSKWCAQCCPTAESYEKLMAEWMNGEESSADT